MQLRKIDHLGILVRDLDKSVSTYKRLGLSFKGIEELKEFGIKTAFFDCAGVLLELVQPIDGLKERSEGLHHICYEVDDVDDAMSELGSSFVLRDRVPRPGANNTRIFFVEPSETCGVLTEFAQIMKN
jgi:methylmalonyl-CoA/ethylmalonyl-CoA epimerase